jgi:hypothetical protein
MIKFTKWNQDHVHAFMAFASAEERKAIRSAKRLNIFSEHVYDGTPLFAPDWWDGAGLSGPRRPTTVGTLLDYCKANGIERPPYAWPVKSVSYSIDVVPDLDSVYVIDEGAV